MKPFSRSLSWMPADRTGTLLLGRKTADQCLFSGTHSHLLIKNIQITSEIEKIYQFSGTVHHKLEILFQRPWLTFR
jgi:hypothetical protein